MSLEIVPPPEKRPSSFSQRRVKSYDESAAEQLQGQGQGQGRDYDRHRITQFIRQPFSTSAAGDDDAVTTSAGDRDLLGGSGGSTAAAGGGGGLRGGVGGSDKLIGRMQRNSLPVSVRYNDTGSFEEVDEEKVHGFICTAV